ncbi:MAG: ATP-binding protein [Treponema sp.]|uniref:ATP-binding protein n=1 Tax=Treponema sp. TaxID=166 RepID=UPI0025EB28C4|nr:ATP-binding protein [Treponema sp.]MBQ9282137.1 ATP-binding protein [Treponema sp.]
MNDVRRLAENELQRCADHFPVVTVLGPRQSGKTTLVKSYFKNYSYINLEDPEFYDLAKNDVNAFFSMIKGPAILDEVQRIPELLDKIQVIVDERKENAQFILTGSFQQGLKSAISQSLAGRTAIINLLPFSIQELNSVGIDFSKDEFLYQGFMPRLYSEGQPADLLYRSYFQTYVERDVQTLLNVKNKALFEKFLHILAGRIGQVVNYESLANDTGVSKTTVEQWISVLESSFIIFKLEPYFENYTKRLIKSPKIYFYETGLTSYLLGIKNPDQISRDPLVGNLFENMVIVEILKSQFNKGMEKSLYYFRDSKGFEIDLIIADGRKIIPVEIKSASTYNRDFSKNLKKICSFAPNAFSPTVIYSGNLEIESEEVKYINFKNCGNLIV